jgi:Tfp pilus assembly protein PilO
MTSNRRRNSVLLGVGSVIVVAAIAWLIILSPRFAQSTDLLAQAESVEVVNVSQQRRLTELTKMAQDAPTAAERVQGLLSRMPQEAQLPEIFTQITEAAQSAGIPAEKISAITQAVPVPLDDPTVSATGAVADAQESALRANIRVAKLDVTVSVTGSLAQVQDFVNNIEGLNRDFLLTGLTVANQSGGDAGADRVATLTTTTFILQSKLPDLVKNVEDLLRQAKSSLESP